MNKINIKYPYNQKPEQVGLQIKDNNVIFTFPMNYYDEKKEDITVEELDEKSSRDILKLLRLISRYKSPEEINDFNSQKENAFPIKAYLWIIKDYVENGYYKDKEETYTINGNGKINWKKTIKNNKIFFDEKNIIYKELITKKINYDIENTITKIHKTCIQIAIKTLGFLYQMPITKNNIYLNEKTKLNWLQIMKNAKLKEFNDYKKELFSNIIEMLEGLDTKKLNSQEISITTKDFEYVYERLINDLLGTENPHDYYLSGHWKLEGHEEKMTPIRPDTVCKIDENNIVVIDSKYYTYGYRKGGTLPSSSDMQKQITYAKYIKDELIEENQNVYNVFILPKNNNYKSENKNFNYIGYSELVRDKSETKNQNNEEYKKIYTFLINLRKLVEGKLEKDTIIKTIVEEISKHQDIM